MSDDLPPALREMRERFREAARRDIEIERRVHERVRNTRRKLWLTGAAVIAVAAAGAATASRVFDREGPVLPSDTLPATVASAADPGVITSTAVADPGGGPPWALRVFTNPTGLDCIAVGRFANGHLGTYSQHVFRPLPSKVSGACGSLAHEGLIAALQTYNNDAPRTVVYGLARDGHIVEIDVGGRTIQVHPKGLGGFIAVREGNLPGGTPVSVRTATPDGRTIRRTLLPVP